MRGTRLNRQSSRAARLEQKLMGSGQSIVKRETADLYQLMRPLGAGAYWAAELVRLTGLLGGYDNVYQLRGSQIGQILIGKDTALANGTQQYPVTYAGGGWTHTNPRAEAFGGGYSRTTSNGASATWDTAAGSTKVGVNFVAAANAGVITVEIDGSKTAANLLPTAQNLFDAGLITSGQRDTLGATTRVLNQYAPTSNWNKAAMLADGLAPGVHTVKLTTQGVGQTGATETRLYLSAVYHGSESTLISDTDAYVVPEHVFSTAQSAWEFAYIWLQQGASFSDFVGNVHGYENQTALTFAADGLGFSLAVGEAQYANEFEIVRTSELFDPDGGTPKIGNCSVTYRLSARGLRIRHIQSWVSTGSCRGGYSIMYPFDGTHDRALFEGRRAVFNIAGGGDTPFGQIRSPAVFVWKSGGRYCGGVRMLTRQSVNSWVRSSSDNAIRNAILLDRDDGVHKVYFARVAPSPNHIPEPVVPGDVWVSEAIYLGGRLSGSVDDFVAAA